MSNIINSYKPAISVITEIELLCWKAATNEDVKILNSFISDCTVFELDTEIKSKTIDIRKTYNIKLPDSIIAATAIVMNLTLISNDRKGFNKIVELNVLDLFV